MADLVDELRALAARIEKTKSVVLTEEATKNAFVLPFISALGYDVFNPLEVTPELNADVGLKKGEKVDYAVLKDGKPIMLFECKHHETNLDNEHASQLYRYFSCSECRIAVLTNGIEYRFFSDLEAPNRMDSKPFLVFKLTDFPLSILPELKKLSKSAFNLGSILSTANELKYMREIKALLGQQVSSPSEEFVRFCARGIGIRVLTSSLKEQLTQLSRKAFSEFIAERVNETLKTALGGSSAASETSQAVEPPSESDQTAAESQIVTTVEELEGYYIVKAIVGDLVEPKRVSYRDAKSYFSVLLDNSNRKPIVRLYFNRVSKKLLGMFNDLREEVRVEIDGPESIYEHAATIRDTVRMYLGENKDSV